MANGYVDLVGAMPNPKTLAWFDWYRDLLNARNQEVNEAVASNALLHFDFTSGNDTTGTGTSAAPYKTIDKANDLMASNTTFLFKRGIEWPEVAGLIISGKSRVKIGQYGPATGNPIGTVPLLSNFTVTLAASGWTDDTGVSGTWYRAAASEIGWIRETTVKDKRFDFLRHMNSVAGVAATPNSWFWDTGSSQLHIFLANAADSPNSRTYEYSLASSFTDGCLIENSDLVLVEGIRFDGWGCRLTTASDRYAVRVNGTTTPDCRVVVRDCEGYYNGTHNFGSTQNTVKVLWQRLRAGGAINQSGGTIAGNSTPFVHFAADLTGTESINDGCIIRNGDMPTTAIASGFRNNNNPFYMHDNSSTTKPDLVIFANSYEKIDTTRTHYIATSGKFPLSDSNTPGTEGDESTYRILIVNHRRDLPLPYRFNFLRRVWHANHRYYGTWLLGDTTNATYYDGGFGASGGHGVNLMMYLRENQANQARSLLVAGGTSLGNGGNTVKLWNCSFGIDGLGTTESPASQWNIEQAPATNDVAQLKNCLFIRFSQKSITKYTSSTTHGNVLTNCAGYNVRYDATSYAAFDNEPGFINLPYALDPQMNPSGSALVGAGVDIGLEYDNELRPRPFEDGGLPTIGAIEGNPLDLVGSVTFDNLDIYNDILFDDKTRRALAVALGSKVLADQVVAKLTNPATMNAAEQAALEVALADPAYAAQVAARISP